MPGVVDEDVDAAEARHGLDRPPPSTWARSVTSICSGSAARPSASNLVRQAAVRRASRSPSATSAPGLRQRERGRASQAARRAGDERDLIRQRERRKVRHWVIPLVKLLDNRTVVSKVRAIVSPEMTRPAALFTGARSILAIAGALLSVTVAVASRQPVAATAWFAQPPTTAWPTYNGDYSGRRFSPLSRINAKTVSALSLAWVYRADAGATRGGGVIKSTPLQIDGVLYFTVPDHVWAVDARSGRERWHYTWPSTGGNHLANRGVAVLGEWLFFETPDCHLVSLNVKDGRERWRTSICDLELFDYGASAPVMIGDHVPTVWDAGSGSPVRDLALRHNDAHWTSNIAYSRDGSLIAGALGNTTPGTGTVAVWEAGSGRRVATLGKPQGKYDAVKQVVFSPDSTLLAGITEAGRLHVWRMAGGREILSRMVVNGGGNGVSFSPDSALVAASGSTGVSIWNTADGARVARLPGAANVQAVQFSPDGTELATGGQDQTIRIWDVSTNRTILTLTGHSATINSVAFSPDGTRVASASDDRTVRVYDLDTERLIRIAQSRLTRHLTLAECRQYLHTDSCTSSDGGAHTAQRGLWTTSATDDSAPVGAYRLTVLPSDFPPGYEAAEDRIGVYTLSLEMGRWRLFQLKPSGETWETSGTYRVGPGRRLFLTDRGDPGCYGMAMSANWSRAGTLLSFSNARATMTPTCEPGASNTMRARGLLASRPWSSVVV